jgi:protein SCO1/2
MARPTDTPAAAGRRSWQLPTLPLPIVIAFTAVLLAVAVYSWVQAHGSGRFRLAPYKGEQAAEFTLRDADGGLRSLGDFRGKVVVLFFGYTRCPEACPAELFKLSQVMQQLGARRRDVQVLMVTLDPEHDSAALLQEYVRAFDPAFIGLTGSAAQIQRAAAAYDVLFRRVRIADTYTISHSTMVYVIDQRGRQRLAGNVNTSVADFVHDLRLLADES